MSSGFWPVPVGDSATAGTGLSERLASHQGHGGACRSGRDLLALADDGYPAGGDQKAAGPVALLVHADLDAARYHRVLVHDGVPDHRARPDPGVVQQHGALYAGAVADPHPRRKHRLADQPAGYVRAPADQAADHPPGPAAAVADWFGRE